MKVELHMHSWLAQYSNIAILPIDIIDWRNNNYSVVFHNILRYY